MLSGKVKRFRLEPQDKKTKVPKLMLGNFFSNYQLLKKKKKQFKEERKGTNLSRKEKKLPL